MRPLWCLAFLAACLVLVIGEDEPLHEGEEKKPVKVLIAGSGLYASLVAYAVRKLFGAAPLEIDVVTRTEKADGRTQLASHTVPHEPADFLCTVGGGPLAEISTQLGWKTQEAREFQVTNGEKVVFQASKRQWLHEGRAALRYGKDAGSLKRLWNVCIKMHQNLQQQAAAGVFNWNVSEYLPAMAIDQLAGMSFLSFLEEHGIESDSKIRDEIVGSMTSFMYMQGASANAVAGCYAILSLYSNTTQCFESTNMASQIFELANASVRTSTALRLVREKKWQLQIFKLREVVGLYDTVIFTNLEESSRVGFSIYGVGQGFYQQATLAVDAHETYVTAEKPVKKFLNGNTQLLTTESCRTPYVSARPVGFQHANKSSVRRYAFTSQSPLDALALNTLFKSPVQIDAAYVPFGGWDDLRPENLQDKLSYSPLPLPGVAVYMANQLASVSFAPEFLQLAAENAAMVALRMLNMTLDRPLFATSGGVLPSPPSEESIRKPSILDLPAPPVNMVREDIELERWRAQAAVLAAEQSENVANTSRTSTSASDEL